MHVTERPIHKGFALLLLLMSVAAGCGHRAARANVPIAPARLGATETGIASWYGIPYHGRRAASGEIYDMEKLTAAHRMLPFHTWVEVTNLENGKRIEVRINDRGPFSHGRIIDLSQAAARDIDMLRSGTARVRLRVIAPPAEEPPVVPVSAEAIASIGCYTVQAGAFAERARADALRMTLEDQFADARVFAGPGNLWRVVVGREMTFAEATDLAARVGRESGAALVIPEPSVPRAEGTNLQ